MHNRALCKCLISDYSYSYYITKPNPNLNTKQSITQTLSMKGHELGIFRSLIVGSWIIEWTCHLSDSWVNIVNIFGH